MGEQMVKEVTRYACNVCGAVYPTRGSAAGCEFFPLMLPEIGVDAAGKELLSRLAEGNKLLMTGLVPINEHHYAAYLTTGPKPGDPEVLWLYQSGHWRIVGTYLAGYYNALVANDLPLFNPRVP